MLSHITFFFLLWTEPTHIKFRKTLWSTCFWYLKHQSICTSILQFHWSNQKLLVHQTFLQEGVRFGWDLTLIFNLMCDDIGVFHPVIIILATVANLRSLDLSLTINLIVDSPKFRCWLPKDVSSLKQERWTLVLNSAYSN